MPAGACQCSGHPTEPSTPSLAELCRRIEAIELAQSRMQSAQKPPTQPGGFFGISPLAGSSAIPANSTICPMFQGVHSVPSAPLGGSTVLSPYIGVCSRCLYCREFRARVVMKQVDAGSLGVVHFCNDACIDLFRTSNS